MNREQWLEQLTTHFTLLFQDIGHPLPDNIKVSVGWPSKGGLGSKKRRVGECWASESKPDAPVHVFISPLLNDPFEVAATHVHELCHAALRNKGGHGAPFKKLMLQVGLDGKATATHAGPELTLRIKDALALMPPFPHPMLEYDAPPQKPQRNRQLKLVCATHKDYIVRASKKVINSKPPLCGECGEPMKEAA